MMNPKKKLPAGSAGDWNIGRGFLELKHWRMSHIFRNDALLQPQRVQKHRETAVDNGSIVMMQKKVERRRKRA